MNCSTMRPRRAVAAAQPPSTMARVPWALLGLGVVLLSACGGGLQVGAAETGRFARPSGSLQCEASRLTAVERQRVQTSLEAVGIRVQSMSCGHDGRPRITLCGAESGELLVVDVALSSGADPSSSEVHARMVKQGFQPWSVWPEARTQACPPG